MKIKEVQASGVVSLGARFINLSGSQLAIVDGEGEDQKIVALLGPANDATTALQAELMLRALQGDNAVPSESLLAIVRSEIGGWSHYARSLQSISEALAATATVAQARRDSLVAIVAEAEEGVSR